MRRCGHTNWLSLDNHGSETNFIESDRLQTLTSHVPNADVKQPSLFVLIGNTAKLIALRELFGVKSARRYSTKRRLGELHLHLDASSIFCDRPIYIADGDFPTEVCKRRAANIDKCHGLRRRTLQRGSTGPFDQSPDDVANEIFTRLLFPFVDVFCIFSADLGGFRNVACRIARWLEKGHRSRLPRSTYPRVIVVTEEIPLGAEYEETARKDFLSMLKEETTKDLFEQIAAIDVVALSPHRTMSVNTRHRRLKENLMDGSDQVRSNRRKIRSLFSVTHFTAFLQYACEHFSNAVGEPFNFIDASRIQNPIATDLEEHLSNFLEHIRSIKELTEFAVPIIASSLLLDSYPPDSHVFEPSSIFKVLYKDVLYRVGKGGAITFEGSTDMILRSGFVNTIESYLQALFERHTQEPKEPAAEIHRRHHRDFQDRWHATQSYKTCFSCLRRRPQYGLPCGHCVCEICIQIFVESCAADPCIFEVHECFLCGTKMAEKVIINVHPPTAGIGILSIDGGGTRGVVPLKLMKRIEERIQALAGIRIPLQKFCKLSFGISSGGLIVLGLYVNGWSVEKCMERFEKLAHIAFKPRQILKIPVVSFALELATSLFTDGLYPAQNIEAALKEVFGTEKTILDPSYATTIGAKIGVPVATIQDSSYCIFTNYNGVGSRSKDQGYHVIRPNDTSGRVPVWEIARAASAAQGIFPVKEISGVGTFQDAGTLENNPLVSTLAELRVLFPLIEAPDFVISLGTGAPKIDIPNADGPRSLWKDGSLNRLWRLAWEKMRDRRIWHAFKHHPEFHRLDINFEGVEPRLDDTRSMSRLKSSVQMNHSISNTIDKISRCAIASLFYFELESIPDKHGDEHIGSGHILCLLRENDPDFQTFINQLARNSAYFCLNNSPISGIMGDSSCLGTDGNFRKRIEIDVGGRFAISLKQGRLEARNDSGSPYSIDKLVTAQGLTAYFGRADHRKRKRSTNIDTPKVKRRRK